MLGNQAASTLNWYPTQSHYHDIEVTCPILFMWSARPGGDKGQFYMPSHWLDREPNSRSPPREPRSLPSQPPHRVRCCLPTLKVGWSNDIKILKTKAITFALTSEARNHIDRRGPGCSGDIRAFMWWNGSTLARNARGSRPALGAVFPIFITPTTLWFDPTYPI